MWIFLIITSNPILIVSRWITHAKPIYIIAKKETSKINLHKKLSMHILLTITIVPIPAKNAFKHPLIASIMILFTQDTLCFLLRIIARRINAIKYEILVDKAIPICLKYFTLSKFNMILIMNEKT